MDNGQQMRFTDEELELVRSVFGGNDKLLKLMRKFFLPEIDPNAPIGQIVDLWLNMPLDGKTPEQALIDMKARNAYIVSIEGRLMELQTLAKPKASESELKERAKKNSTA